jgi:hypothetical protein
VGRFHTAARGSYDVGIVASHRSLLRRTQTFVLSALLFLLNAYLCYGLFGVEYLRHMGSIEPAYIGLSRYMLAHWRDFSWFPAWYAGIPAQNAYPPVLPWVVSLAALLRGVSTAHAYHWVTALIYCLGPVALFALTLRLSGSPRAAFLAGVLYSSLSPSEWLIPAIGRATGQFHPERLTALVFYGESPHIVALTLIPLAILLLDLALERKRAPYFALAVLSFSSVALTNWLGAFTLALGTLAYVLARGVPSKLFARDVGFVIFLAMTAYCLTAPWIPPSTIATVHTDSKLAGGNFTEAGTELLHWTPAILLILLVLKLVFRRFPTYFQFAIFFAFLTALPPLANTWANTAIVPQPERYHLEMELALALLAGLLLDAALRRLPARPALFATIALLLALIWPIKSDRHYARDALILTIDITTTSEWRTAQWLNQHWRGGRVMLPGSSMFWLAAFSDTPQIGGAFDQGVTIPVYGPITYEIASGDSAGSHAAEIAMLWFKALGVQAVAVSGPGSTEVYKRFSNPAEFEGILQPLWRDRGDVLYDAGSPTSLAHVMAASDLVTKMPINGIDLAPLRPYVAALVNPRYPPASFEWTSLHSARIQTDLPPNSVVSIQVSWSAGWHATMNGRVLRVLKDALGFMYVVPSAAGPASISMDYDGGAEMIAAHWISGVTLALLALACLIPRRFLAWLGHN